MLLFFLTTCGTYCVDTWSNVELKWFTFQQTVHVVMFEFSGCWNEWWGGHWKQQAVNPKHWAARWQRAAWSCGELQSWMNLWTIRNNSIIYWWWFYLKRCMVRLKFPERPGNGERLLSPPNVTVAPFQRVGTLSSVLSLLLDHESEWTGGAAVALWKSPTTSPCYFNEHINKFMFLFSRSPQGSLRSFTRAVKGLGGNRLCQNGRVARSWDLCELSCVRELIFSVHTSR